MNKLTNICKCHVVGSWVCSNPGAWAPKLMEKQAMESNIRNLLPLFINFLFHFCKTLQINVCKLQTHIQYSFPWPAISDKTSKDVLSMGKAP